MNSPELARPALGEDWEARERLRKLVELLPIGVWMADAAGNIVMSNEAGRRIWGGARYVGIERFGEYKAWWPDGRRIAAEDWPLARAIRHGETRINDEIEIECFDGTRKTMLNSAAPIRDEQGRLLGALVTNEDITERKRAERALRESHERFEIVARATNDAVWDWDLLAGIVKWNPGYQALFGYAPEQTKPGPESWADYIHPEDKARVLASIHEVIDGSGQAWSAEYRFQRRDGSYAEVLDRGFVVRDSDSRAVRMIGAMADLSGRKLVERALRDSEARLRVIARLSSDWYWEQDEGLRFTLFVGGVGEKSGNAPENAIGRRRWELDGVTPISQSWEEHRAVLGARLPFRGFVYARTGADGGQRRVEASGEPVFDLEGNFRGYRGVGVDVTERERVDAERIGLLERDAAILRALGEIVYEWRPKADELHWRGDYTRILGYAHSEMGANTESWTSRVHAEDLRAVLAEVDAARREGRGFDLQYRFRHRDGHYVWMHDRGVLFLDAAGEIDRVIGVFMDVTQRKRYEGRIEHLANFDALTDLPNRNLLRDRVEQAIAHARRSRVFVGLMFVDLDNFKFVNDSWGHAAGDALLLEVGRRLQAAVRDGDTVARLGGDEFVILLSDLARPGDTAVVAGKIAAALAAPVRLADGREVSATASIGISLFPGDGEDLDALLQCADAAMYRAKDAGRNTFHYYSAEMSAQARARMETELGLRQALERGELRLYYQPQVDLRTGAIRGFEALLRWEHPQRGLVSPASFIALAEESGLIVPIGQWALREACREAAGWQAAGLGPLRVAVNLSARQFWQGSVTEAVRAALADSGLAPAQLELEITESVVARDLKQVVLSLEQLRRMGITVAIDDFGTGYSSLAYLRSLPIGKLKIDRSFIQGIPIDREAAALVAEIVRLAHVLSLEVVAEGVETEAQAAFLRDAGCEAMQGFVFSRPLPAAECAPLVRSRRFVIAGSDR